MNRITRLPLSNTLRRISMTPVAVAIGLLLHGLASAQTAPFESSFKSTSTLAPLGAASQVYSGTSSGGVDYRANAQVASLIVEVEKNDLAADGVSPNRVTIRALDAGGQPIVSPSGKLFATIEISGGRILLDGAKTDEFGPGGRDADRVIPGTQVELVDGVAVVTLLAPIEAQNVRVRVTMGSAVAQGVVSYLPELREFVAAGLLEGIVAARGQGNTSPTRIDDGFEKELRRWADTSADGKRTVGVRSAFFVKGQLQNDWLLTAAFDSDKETNRLFRDPRSDEMYPVYGDSALRGSEAKSADKLYLRLDKGRNYGLYGDFNTAGDFSQLTTGTRLRNLGAYSRTATGLKTHFEDTGYHANAYYFQSNLKQVVEEYRGNGTSGPFYVASRAGVQGTDKVEIITRDRNQLGLVLNTLALVRFDDYTFEPFSGAILLKSPAPSLDANGNPRYIRITYEVEQGGPSFAAYGLDGQIKIGELWEVGASVNRDDNPLSPYTLMSVNTAVQLGANTRVVAEVARSRSTRYLFGESATTTPSGGAGETRNDRAGSAYRLEIEYQKDALQASAWLLESEPEFYNPSSSVSEGKNEAGARADLQLTDTAQLYGEISRTQQKTLATEASRDAAALGVVVRPNKNLSIDISLRNTQEDAGFTGGSTISSNPLVGGGFFGLGTDGVNPMTGISNIAPIVGTASTQDRRVSSVRVAATWAPSEHLTLIGEVEAGTADQQRYALGAQYQLSERSKVFGRYESQRGLTSSYALNPADKSDAFNFGVESAYMQGGTLFSEYRLRDALSGSTAANRDMQLATGVRNTWNVSEGLAYTTNAEVLKVYQGGVRDAFALGGGVDYRVNELSQFSGRLEWRGVLDDKKLVGDQTENQYLSTVSFARKVDRDWTLLARNYLLVNTFVDGTRVQDRLQVGAAWRPVDHNRLNALARYEYKTQRDTRTAATQDDTYDAHVVSLHAVYHPSRPWWLSSRLAYKDSVSKLTNPDASVVKDNFSAVLVGARATYDISKNWDISLAANVLQGLSKDKARQYGSGLEVGYLISQDLWLSVGVNFTGFSDRDLTSGEYTNKGAFVRLRYKFDENLFRGANKSTNRALER